MSEDQDQVPDAFAGAIDSYEVVFSGEFTAEGAAAMFDQSPTNVTIRPRYAWWQRVWMFILRHKPLPTIEMRTAEVGPLHFDDDGTMSIEFRAKPEEV